MVSLTNTDPSSPDTAAAHGSALRASEEIGRIPFVLRIGITGHRTLSDPDAVAGSLRDALRLVRQKFPTGPATPLVLVAVSALAEGADRLLADQVLAEPGARLEAVLPMPRAGYLRDFKTAASRREFNQLLARASRVSQAPPRETKEAGYEWAGRHVADRCDVLIAVWDGLPGKGRGGTKEIVDYARERQVPLIWIRPGDADLHPELGVEAVRLLQDAARDLDRFNAGRIPERVFESQVASQLSRLGLDALERPAQNSFLGYCDEVAARLVPFFVRADVQALRLQRRFRVLSMSTFTMAALAVAIVAVQVSFWPAANWIVGFEVLLLLLLLAIPLLRDRLQLHERWTSYRFLAERLRSAYFLALAGTTDRAHSRSESSFSDPSVAWIERALAEITAGRRHERFAAVEVEPLHDYLSKYWIGDQACYHHKASMRHEKWDNWLRRATLALFGITLVSAVLHLAGAGSHGADRSTLAATLIVVSICVPAIGAAVHGVETQGEYRRHSRRFGRMETLLRQLRKQMESAQDLAHVQLIATEVERTMREEANDWFGVMRFHDVELIT